MMLIFPWPGVDLEICINYKGDWNGDGTQNKLIAPYRLSDFIFALMIMRVFFIFRTISNYMIWTDAYSKKVCRENGVKNSNTFVYKCMFAIQPELTMGLSFLFFVLLSGYLVRIFELPLLNKDPYNDSNLDNYFNAFYLSFITISTVGYGDLHPITYPGKIIMMIASIIGAFMISLIVLILSQTFDMTR